MGKTYHSQKKLGQGRKGQQGLQGQQDKENLPSLLSLASLVLPSVPQGSGSANVRARKAAIWSRETESTGQ
jgi:hypothetical protein